MLHGRTSDAIARANTAILMQLIKRLIDGGVLTKEGVIALLDDAAGELENGPNATGSAVMDAVTIIRKELLPRISPVG
jgi:hypothetical protein